VRNFSSADRSRAVESLSRKKDSQTLILSFSVKPALRVGSISASHFPQTSICVSLISSLNISVVFDFIHWASRQLLPHDKQSGHSVLYRDSLFACNLSIKRRTGPNCIFRGFNAIQKFVSVDLRNSGPVELPPVIRDPFGLLRKDCSRSFVVR
jgi:hypothetical protein